MIFYKNSAIKSVMKSGIFNISLVIGLTISSAVSFAQVGNSDTQTLLNRIQQMDNQIQTLSRFVYKGDTSPSGQQINVTSTTSSNNNNAALTMFDQRLSSLEQQIRSLTGQVERAEFENRQLKTKITAMENSANQQRIAIPNEAPKRMTLETVAKESAQEEIVAPRYDSDNVIKIENSTSTLNANDVVIESPASNNLPLGGPSQDYDVAFALVKSGDYEQAEKKLTAFLKNYPDDSLSDNARYWRAETFYVRGDFERASVSFAEAFQKNNEGSKSADNLLKLGMSLGKLAKSKEACLTFAELEKRFPNASADISKRLNDQKSTYQCVE